MAINVNKIKKYLASDLNIIITGPAGTGKTAMLMAASEELGLKMKYYSTSTLDPFADLLGIPVVNEETKSVNYYRPVDIDNAEVIFFDELNRAEPKTLNAVFEIIQFRSINGEKLPNLKTVVAAINPVSDEYDTDELDLALLDRFDLYLDAEVKAEYSYFRKKYGAAYARAGVQMFDTYQKDYNNPHRSDKNKMGYFSPRRLDKLMSTFKLFPNESTIREVLPHDVVVSTKQVTEQFNIALKNKAVKKKPKKAPVENNLDANGNVTLRGSMNRQVQLPDRIFSTKSNAREFKAVYEWAKKNASRNDLNRLRKKTVEALSESGIGPVTVSYFVDVINDMTTTERQSMYKEWPPPKRKAMREKFPEAQYGWNIPKI